MSASTNPELRATAKEVCRRLRKSQTPAEAIVWQALRNRKFHGLKFYRQYPIFVDWLETETFFVADFFCFEECLVIEIDGRLHDYQADHDRLRTFIINELGLHVIRVRNDELERDRACILDKVERALFKDARSNRKART